MLNVVPEQKMVGLLQEQRWQKVISIATILHL
jgi:hypothetical protein